MRAMRCVTTALAAAAASVCSAAIVGGDLTIIAPPAETGQDNQQVNALLGFNERQNVLLAADLAVDGGSIEAGTRVSSHLLIFDPADGRAFSGVVTFDGPVLGVISSRGGLIASDSLLGLPAVTYLSPSARGLEGPDAYELINAFALRLTLGANSPGDHLRVITGPRVPAPATLAGLGGLLIIGGRRRR